MQNPIAQSQLWRAIIRANAAQLAQALAAGADPNLPIGPAGALASVPHSDMPLHALLRLPAKPRDPASGQLRAWPKGALGECLTLLLDAGASLSALDAQGNTPLMLLCNRQAADIPAKLVSRLVKASRDVLEHAEPVQGNTAMHIACEAQATDKIKALIAGGANPNSLNQRGETPAWQLVNFIHVELVFTKPRDQRSWESLERIVAQGGDLNIPNSQGEFAWMKYPVLPLSRLAALGANLGARAPNGQDALVAQIEHLEAKPASCIYTKDNIRALMQLPGIDWTGRSRKSGRNAAQVMMLVYDEEFQQLAGEARALVEQAELQASTGSVLAAERKPRL